MSAFWNLPRDKLDQSRSQWKEKNKDSCQLTRWYSPSSWTVHRQCWSLELIPVKFCSLGDRGPDHPWERPQRVRQVGTFFQERIRSIPEPRVLARDHVWLRSANEWNESLPKACLPGTFDDFFFFWFDRPPEVWDREGRGGESMHTDLNILFLFRFRSWLGARPLILYRRIIAIFTIESRLTSNFKGSRTLIFFFPLFLVESEELPWRGLDVLGPSFRDISFQRTELSREIDGPSYTRGTEHAIDDAAHASKESVQPEWCSFNMSPRERERERERASVSDADATTAFHDFQHSNIRRLFICVKSRSKDFSKISRGQKRERA